MKKLIFTLLFVLLFISPPRTFAISDRATQSLIDTSLLPIDARLATAEGSILSLQTLLASVQTSINALQSSLTSLQATVTNLLDRVTALENAEPDFSIPVNWIKSFSSTSKSISLSSAKTGDTCAWNGVVTSAQVLVRGIAHVPGGDAYAAGNCSVVGFAGISNYPPSGTTFPIELFFFWDGKSKHDQFTVTIP